MGNLVFQATLGGQVNLVGPNTASTFNLNVPAVAGTLVTTGDTGTVTNTMLAGSIANAKLTNSSVTVGSTSIALGATSTTLDGVNIGATTAGTGAFTTLSASSTVSGTGFSTYLASPPAIGGTAAAAGTFTTLSGTTSVTTPIVKSASSLTLQTNGSTTALTIDTSQNTTLAGTLTTSSRGITKSSMPAGTVLQVVQGTFSNQISTTSSSLTSTGWSASITPLFSTSKILVRFVTNATVSGGAANAQFTLYRGGSTLSSSNGCVMTVTSGAVWVPIFIEYLDSPATTSATTYNIYYSTTANTLVANISAFGQATAVTLMEIAQ